MRGPSLTAIVTCSVLASAWLSPGASEPTVRPQTLETFPRSATIPELIESLRSIREEHWIAQAELANRGTPAIEALLDLLHEHPFLYVVAMPGRDDSIAPEALAYIGSAARPAIVRRLSALLDRVEPTTGVERNLYEASSLLHILGGMGADSVPAILDVAERSREPLRGAALQELGNMAYEPPIGDAFLAARKDAAAFSRTISPLLPRLRALMRVPRPDQDASLAANAWLVARFGTEADRHDAIARLLEAVRPAADARWMPLDPALETLARLRAPQAAPRLMDAWLSRERRVDPETITIAMSLYRLGDVRYREPLVALLTRPYGNNWSSAVQLAAASHDLALVPALIDLLDDRAPAPSPFGWTGIETPRSAAGVAWQALRLLTMEELGPDLTVWRDWWQANEQSRWEDVVRQRIGERVAGSASAPAWMMNRWMADAFSAADALVLPLVDAYLARPEIDPMVIGPDERRLARVVEGNRRHIPIVVRLLAALDQNGVAAARPRLHRCLEARNWRIRQWAALPVSFFDRPAAVASLARDLAAADPWVSVNAAEILSWVGDARGIPVLIERLGSADVESGDAACRVLHRYTIAPLRCQSTSPAERTSAVEAWRQWWRANADTFTVRRPAG